MKKELADEDLKIEKKLKIKLIMPRTLSKKPKKQVSWKQRGRNRKLKSQLKKLDEERGVFYKLTKK